MSEPQREQNPDVNSYQPDTSPAEGPGVADRSKNKGADVERKNDRDVIPVPPDLGPTAPVEDPPAGGDSPTGDVDDSPERIV